MLNIILIISLLKSLPVLLSFYVPIPYQNIWNDKNFVDEVVRSVSRMIKMHLESPPSGNGFRITVASKLILFTEKTLIAL